MAWKPRAATSLLKSLASGEDSNASLLTMDVHTGTHVDAPRHFLATGGTVDQVSLDRLIGPALVVDVPDVDAIDGATLEALDVPADAERLLLRTENSTSGRSRKTSFDPEYAALTVSGARWVVERRLKLIGIDYLSIQRFDESPEVHRILLGAEVAILEGLLLDHVGAGGYELLCLPLQLHRAEAAPARAILRPRETHP